MIENLLRTIFDNYQVKVLVTLIAANFLVATFSAFKSGQFSLEKVGAVISDKLVPYMVAYAAASLLAIGAPDLAAIREACWVALMASGVGNVLRNIQEFGIQVPDK